MCVAESHPRIPDSEGLGWDPRIRTSPKFLGYAGAAGPGTTPGESFFWRLFISSVHFSPLLGHSLLIQLLGAYYILGIV